MSECKCCRNKLRNAEEKKLLMNRLARMEGQLRGIRNMVDCDAYCVDIINQMKAVQSAVNSFNKELLASHIRTCVADGVRSGDDEKIEELVETVQKLMK